MDCTEVEMVVGGVVERQVEEVDIELAVESDVANGSVDHHSHSLHRGRFALEWVVELSTEDCKIEVELQ